MARKFDFDLDDLDDIFNKKSNDVVEQIVVKNEDDYYQDFIQESDGYSVMDSDYSDEEVEDDKDVDTSSYSSQSIFDYLSLFYTWFSRIGVGIMIILMAVFITNGDFLGLFKYILLLIGSFFFGYFFMYFLDRYKENN